MGTSYGDFFKYPRTPHLFGSKGTDDDKHMNNADSRRFIADESLIVEEKIDGTNCGIHQDNSGKMVLQCRGHEIRAGMHPQYDLFKQWVSAKTEDFKSILGTRYVMYGEWLYAKHSILYSKLPHYFFEFDIFDKNLGKFLDLNSRKMILNGTGIQTVPVIHSGKLSMKELVSLIKTSSFGADFFNSETGKHDDRMEGLYLRTEKDGFVTGRAKIVRPEFTEEIKKSDHWQSKCMVQNSLIKGADIWT